MNFIKNLIRTFIYILAGITICTAIFITIFLPNAQLTYHLFWQIIGMSAVCTIGSLIYYSKKEPSKSFMAFRILIHYLYINIVVLSGSIFLEWVQPEKIWEMIAMLILISIVYFCIMLALFRQEEKTAKDLNKRLRKYTDEDIS